MSKQNFFKKDNLKISYRYYKRSKKTLIFLHGLLSDMNKLINQQKLSFEIDISKIPISKNLEIYLNKYNKNKNQYLFKGDDYQILFTASKKKIINQVYGKKNESKNYNNW